jgi:Cu-Zn family superoxide dismutase
MQTMINDVAVLPGGNAIFTDSIQPMLYSTNASRPWSIGPDTPFQLWLSLRDSIIRYHYGATLGECLNLNGIVASDDGQFLLTIQSNCGALFRINVETKEVKQVTGSDGGDLRRDDGLDLVGGDGLALGDDRLYVIRAHNEDPIVLVLLERDWGSGRLMHVRNHPSLRTPTTAAMVGDRLLIVNSQFDKQGLTPSQNLHCFHGRFG